MKLSGTNLGLRRRTRTSARIELWRNYCLLLLLFGGLVLWFTPPTADKYDKDVAKDSEEHHADPITIVTCEVSTPHSQHPETAAGGIFDIAILNEDLARKGSSAEAFVRNVDDNFYDGCYTFRVIPGFIVQWGHTPDKKANMERILEADKTLPTTDNTEESETMHRLQRKENVKGTISMILGKTGQVFVNIGDNRRLDKDGTIPFGVILDTGMDLIEKIYSDYKGGQGQIPAINNRQVASKFPEMGRIDRCYRK